MDLRSWLIIGYGSAFMLAFFSGVRHLGAPLEPPAILGAKTESKANQDVNQGNPPEVAQMPAQSEIAEALRAIKKQRESERREDSAREAWWWPPSASWAIVYATFLYALVATFQWGAISRQAKLAEKTLSLQFRPELIVRDVRLIESQEGFRVNQPLIVSLSITNKGAGDAKIISSTFVVRIDLYSVSPHRQVYSIHELPDFNDGDLDYFESRLGSPIIEAGMTTVPVAKQRHLLLQPHELEWLVRVPTHAIYAIGMIFYQDAAGRHRKTGFCRKYEYALQRFEVVNDPELEYTY